MTKTYKLTAKGKKLLTRVLKDMLDRSFEFEEGTDNNLIIKLDVILGKEMYRKNSKEVTDWNNMIKKYDESKKTVEELIDNLNEPTNINILRVQNL